MAMIEHKVTIQVDSHTTRQSLEDSLIDAGVPGNAKVSTYHYDSGGDPRESDYTNLIYTWFTYTSVT